MSSRNCASHSLLAAVGSSARARSITCIQVPASAVGTRQSQQPAAEIGEARAHRAHELYVRIRGHVICRRASQTRLVALQRRRRVEPAMIPRNR